MPFERRAVALAVSLLTASALGAAGQEPATGLSRTRQTFRAADRDGNGRVALREAIRGKIPAADFAREDHDQDANLSRDEFVLYYRQLLVRAGRAIASDLEFEAARIQAVRRARSTGGVASDPSVTVAPREPPAHVVTTDGPAGRRVRSQARLGELPRDSEGARTPSELAARDARTHDLADDDR